MLVFPPNKRISVVEALKHPFMQSLHVESDEPSADFEIDFEFESEKHPTRERIQQLIWEEITHYHPGLGPWSSEYGAGSDHKAAESLADARSRPNTRVPVPHSIPPSPIVRTRPGEGVLATAASKRQAASDGHGDDDNPLYTEFMRKSPIVDPKVEALADDPIDDRADSKQSLRRRSNDASLEKPDRKTE